jgi:hypothetical protein
MLDIIHDTPELRAAIEEHNRNAIRLHLPTAPVTWIDLKVESSDGHIVHEHREKANSWLRNFYNFMAALLLPSSAISTGTYGAGCLRLKTMTGMIVDISAYGGNALFSSVGSAGSTSHGILVGTGTNDENFEDSTLQTLIDHGTGTGQLSYQAGELGVPSYDDGTKKWTQTITRIFNNNSSGAITVAETGIRASANYYSVVIERNKLSTPVEVPVAYKLTVTYTTEITFPA